MKPPSPPPSLSLSLPLPYPPPPPPPPGAGLEGFHAPRGGGGENFFASIDAAACKQFILLETLKGQPAWASGHNKGRPAYLHQALHMEVCLRTVSLAVSIELQQTVAELNPLCC